MSYRIPTWSRRLVLKSYKYVAIVAYLLMLSHVILLIAGTPLKIAENSVLMTPVVTVFSICLSWILGYCYMHRVCLLYTGLVSQCIKVQSSGVGFGDSLTIVRIAVMIVGLIVGILLLVKKIKCSYEQE